LKAHTEEKKIAGMTIFSTPSINIGIQEQPKNGEKAVLSLVIKRDIRKN
jgi:hypothetical protein